MFQTEKTNMFQRDWSKFNHEEFILHVFSVDWTYILKLRNNNTDASIQSLFYSMNSMLYKHVSFKKIIKYKLKLKTRPRTTTALQKSFSIKNKILNSYIRKRDITMNFIIIIKSTEILSVH